MGTNTLVTKNDGEIIASSDPNQYKEALAGDLVPRNSAGVPTNEGGDVGTSSIRWKNVRSESVLTNLVQPGSGNLVINSGNQLVITTDGTDDIAIVTTKDLSIDVNKISLSGGGTIASSTGGAMVFGAGLTYQATGNAAVSIASSGTGSNTLKAADGTLELERNGHLVFRALDEFVQIRAGVSAAGISCSGSLLIFNSPSGSKGQLSNSELRFFSGTEIKLEDVYNSTTGAGANVNVASDGRMRRSTSSKKYKKNIKNLDKNEILKLRPVTFDDKANEDITDQIGLIAEEVNEIEPRLAIKNENGDIEGVNYQAIGPMLIPIIRDLKAQVEKLEAKVKKLEAKK